ncbi:hypothetical protein KR51_00030860 [Rubidibacter lacunae KORDI 51-2]|uniref:DUF72 domain-containing protein n=1 Tax=Rubidibacter lacunae KORDI 51-2 TaxID=582515 RepID=U5D7D1_9CHRO|nr:DUF72 domain-containing protein [Rubidibacter lacunae]ERN40538.1 hypothetical protein KR51_00030860 [Rubidibacter lacunae KORDI 51-2]
MALQCGITVQCSDAIAMFWLGCAFWSYKEWAGEFFPPGSRPTDYLRLYSQRLRAVEGNTTFYATPDAATIRRWAAETPPGFAFCPKLPRTVSHAGSLVPQLPEALAFVERLHALGDRLGPLFLQLPPSYGPDAIDDLEQFLMQFLQCWQERFPDRFSTTIAEPRSLAKSDPLPRSGLSVEVRHPSWFVASHADRLTDCLASLGVARVLLDTRPVYWTPDDPQVGARRKPDVPLHPQVTAGFTHVRFISHPEPARNDRFLNEWAERVAAWLHQGTQVYFFVHCPQETRSPHTARDFQKRLEALGAPVPSLPWDRLAPAPEQLRLF